MFAFRWLLGAAVIVVGASLMPIWPTRAQEATCAQPDEKMTALLKARLDLAEKGYETVAQGLGLVRSVGGAKGGLQILVAKPDEAYLWSVRWLCAEYDWNPKRAEIIAAYENHLKRMTQLEAKVKSLAPDIMSGVQTMDAEWYRLEAELWLAKAKR